MAIGLRILAGTVAALLAMALSANADAVQENNDTEKELRWKQLQDRFITADGADAGTAADFYGFSRILEVSGASGPILILSCHVNTEGFEALNAGIQLDPANTYGDKPERTPRILTASGVLTIDGKTQSERFRYHPASSKIVPFDRAVARRLYNAAVTGADVKLKFQGTTYDVDIPAKDKTLVSFAKICPVTNGGTFDHSIFDGIEGAS